jgi:hypothetical protein
VRRNWFIWAIVLGVASIALAALIMRLTANDSSNPSATAWADSVCSDLTTWSSSIQALADVSSGSLNAETLNAKIADAEQATSTLVASLKDLGPPDLESGDALEEELSSAVDEIQSQVEALKQGAEEAAQAGSPRDFLSALATLAPQFQTLLGSVQTTIDDLKSSDAAGAARDELQQAFDDAESCQQLTSDS